MKRNLVLPLLVLAGGLAAFAPALAQKGAAPAPAAPAKAPTEAVDPVCGMRVKTATSPSASHQGKTYWFCSKDDKAKFEKDPAKYARK